MAKLVIIIWLALMIFVGGANADADTVNDPWSPQYFSYLFYLYYDNGQLFADRDFEFKYDIIAEEFSQEKLLTQFPFSGEVINFQGEAAATFQFDPKQGTPDFVKGKISVKAPYFPDGQKVIFYSFEGQPLVTIFVSESSFCNDNSVCNFEKGEDEKTCPNDCRGVVPTDDRQPTTNNGGQSGMLKAAIYVLIVAGAGLGGWFGWKWWKGRKELPPAITESS